MKIKKVLILLVIPIIMNSCASSYKQIQPQTLNYISKSDDHGVTLEYKYDLLDKKYSKKELKKNVKLVALKITNESNHDLIFGRDIVLSYENDRELYVMETNRVFKQLKQSPATYLFYLLLTPVNIYTYETNSYGVQETTNTIPVGLVAGPSLAMGNMIASGSANKKFKTELFEYAINGTVIQKGETKYGLIGLNTKTYDALKIQVRIEDEEDETPIVTHLRE